VGLMPLIAVTVLDQETIDLIAIGRRHHTSVLRKTKAGQTRMPSGVK
jgi:hypothetical protein